MKIIFNKTIDFNCKIRKIREREKNRRRRKINLIIILNNNDI